MCQHRGCIGRERTGDFALDMPEASLHTLRPLAGLAAAQSIIEALKQHLAPPRPQVIPGGPPGALPPQMMQQYAEEEEVAEGRVARPGMPCSVVRKIFIQKLRRICKPEEGRRADGGQMWNVQ